MYLCYVFWMVKKFSESGAREKIVTFKLPSKDRDKLKDFPGMMNQTIRCRLIRVELENGEKEILCTLWSYHEDNRNNRNSRN